MRYFENWKFRSAAIFCLGLFIIQAGVLLSAPDQPVSDDSYNGLCKRITHCDANAAMNPTFVADCPAFFERAQAYPYAASDMAQCVKGSSCDGFEFQSCLNKYSVALREKSPNNKDHDDIVRGSIVGLFGSFGAWKMPEISENELKRFKSKCETLVSCDASFTVYEKPIEICVGLVSGIRNRMPHLLANFEKCMVAPDCGEGRFSQCMARGGEALSTGVQKYEPPGAPTLSRQSTSLVSGKPDERIVRTKLPGEISKRNFFRLKYIPDHSAEATGWKLIIVPPEHQWYCLGLRDGDTIRAINEKPVGRTYGSLELLRINVADSIQSITVQRSNKLLKFSYQHDENSENDCSSEKPEPGVASLSANNLY